MKDIRARIDGGAPRQQPPQGETAGDRFVQQTPRGRDRFGAEGMGGVTPPPGPPGGTAGAGREVTPPRGRNRFAPEPPAQPREETVLISGRKPAGHAPRSARQGTPVKYFANKFYIFPMYFDAAGINPAGRPKEYPPLESAFSRLPRSGDILFPAARSQGTQNNQTNNAAGKDKQNGFQRWKYCWRCLFLFWQ